MKSPIFKLNINITLWYILEVLYIQLPAIDLSNIRCNSSIFLDATNSTVYVSGASDLDHHSVSTSAVSSPSSPAAASAASPGAAAAAAVAFFHSCPLHVRVRPRQTINITLRSFGHYPEADDSPTVESGILRFCSAHMFITEGQRRHSGPLCPGRLRERNMYQSRDSTVGLYFSQQPRKLINAGQRWTFILKIEGEDLNWIHVGVAWPANGRIDRHYKLPTNFVLRSSNQLYGSICSVGISTICWTAWKQRDVNSKLSLFFLSLSLSLSLSIYLSLSISLSLSLSPLTDRWQKKKYTFLITHIKS